MVLFILLYHISLHFRFLWFLDRNKDNSDKFYDISKGLQIFIGMAELEDRDSLSVPM